MEEKLWYQKKLKMANLSRNNVAGTDKFMKWVAKNLPKSTYVNIMHQYHVDYKAYDYPEISRRITNEEYAKVVSRAGEVGLTNLDVQGYWWLKR